MHQDTGYTSGYMIYIRIQGIHKDTGYTSGYRIYIRIQDIHQDTGYTSGYRINFRMNENTGFTYIQWAIFDIFIYVIKLFAHLYIRYSCPNRQRRAL